MYVRVGEAPRTRGYATFNHIYWQQPRDLPPFSFFTIYNMLIDPQVRLCLAIRCAPLFGAEWGFEKEGAWQSGIQARRPEVGAYVQRQLDRIWHRHLHDIAQAQIWGWSAGEVTLKLGQSQLVEIARLEPRRAEDCRLVLAAGSPVGVQVARVQGVSTVDLAFPNCWIHHHNPQPGEHYGQSVLLGAYSPWCDKWLDGGALDVRRLFMHKDAYGGTDLGYPDGESFIDGLPTPVPNRDIARQIVEQIRAGNVITRPSERDERGNERWPLTRATIPANPQHILQYPKDLDDEIRVGIGIADGVIDDGGTGSWAGRRIPMAAFYASLDAWMVAIIGDLTRQVFEPLVMLNWGRAEEFEIRWKPLAEQAMEQQSNAGPGQGTGDAVGAGGQGDQLAAMYQQPQPQPAGGQPPVLADAARMAIEAVGHGAIGAADLAAAAKAALQRAAAGAPEEPDHVPATETGTPLAPDSQSVYRVPSVALMMEPQRFSACATVDRLAAAARWNRQAAGVLLVWRDASTGQDYVVDGHKRLSLANRLGLPEVNVRYISAPSAREARAQGALANIAAGRVSAVGAAAYLRDSRQPPEHLREAGISLQGRMGDEIAALALLPEAEFRVARMSAAAGDVDWKEEEHPRGEGGKFVPKGAGTAHAKHVKQLVSQWRTKTKTGHKATLYHDARAKSKGWWLRHTGPDKTKTDFGERFPTAAAAADWGAEMLLRRDADAPTAPEAHLSPPSPTPKKRQGRNWRYRSPEDVYSAGTKAKFHDNLDALRTLKQIATEERDHATPEEQAALAKFVGWGQFPQAFGYDSGWQKEAKELRLLAGQDGYDSARRSTINSHYTHPGIVRAHWDMAKKLGFDGGRYLEPAVGAGYYIGLMPQEIAEKTATTAVEMDETSGRIAQLLYPEAHVAITPFQRHPTPDNFYDLVATNVPFSGAVRVSDRKYKSMRPTLHDYYFLRSVDTAKPGGLIMHITSAGTMDKLDSRVRDHIDKHCELVSAIRFPGAAHKDNAGTDVVTDMLILRKRNPAIPATTEETPTEAAPKSAGFTGTTVDSLGRLYHWVDGKRVPAPDWSTIVEVPDPGGGEPIRVNKYFADRPAQMLGVLDRTGTMYGGGEKNVTRTDDYEERLQAAIDRLPADVMRTETGTTARPERIEATGLFASGQLVARDGAIYQHDDGALTKLDVNAKDAARITGQIAIRDAARDLIAAQNSGEATDAAREKLNAAYDAFVSKHGALHDRLNRRAMRDDPDGAFLLSLEKWNARAKQADKADLFTKDTIRRYVSAETAGTVTEAAGIVLHETGRLDVERMARLTGQPVETITEELVARGIGYEDPSRGWVPAAEYLSGNTRAKLREAQTAAAADPKFAANVVALEKAQPPDIDYEDIGIKLGSPWVPPETIAEFAAHTIGANPDDIRVRYVEPTAEWHSAIEGRASYLLTDNANREVWTISDDAGNVVLDFHDILDAALNGHQVNVRSASSADESGRHPILPEQTEAAREKVSELQAQFRDWVWTDDERRTRLHRLYNDAHNNIVPMSYDGSHLQFPGMRDDFRMRDIQKNFVWRVITTGKGLAAHEVGTGKTASMVAAAMELRRLGLANKPCIAVKKANIEQITQEAMELYPGAKILSTADMFDAARRRQTLNRIATGDYDMIIMTHDHLEAMKMKPETVGRFIRKEVDDLTDAIMAIKAGDENGGTKSGNRIIKQLENQKLKLEERLRASLDASDKDDIYFEDSGIDQLFVDEAHKFKSLPCYSKLGQIKGVPTSRSDRATDMLARTRYILDKHDGRGVVFATGTPIANTMAELYNMQRFLQHSQLEERGLDKFDAWADTYGALTHRLEYKLDGNVAATTRFAEFVNLPELRHLSSEMMDVQRADNLKNPDGSPVIKRPKKTDHVVVSPEHDGVKAMMADIHARASALKGARQGKKGEDNMLSVCNDAKKGSIDMRLLDPDGEDHPDSKVNQCVRKIVDLYHAHPGTTQAVFSDLGIHPNDWKFSVFDDICRKLVAAGVPEAEIVDFSDQNMKDDKRESAQAAMNRGEVRIALGSTDRLGTGTNIQKRLRAVHHLDIPYVPAYLEQRDGRGYRSGNTNADFDVFRYVQHGSADNLFWQIVANKSHFINQFMLGKGQRTMKELDTDTLTPDEMIAVATGNERMLQRIAVEDEVRQLRRASNRHAAEKSRIQRQIDTAPDRLQELEAQRDRYAADVAHFSANKEFRLTAGSVSHTNRQDAAAALEAEIGEGQKEAEWLRGGMSHIGDYRGADLHVLKGGGVRLTTPAGNTYDSTGNLASIEYAPKAAARRQADFEAQIKQHHADVSRLKESLDQPFRHAAALEEKEAELGRLKAGA